MVVAVALTPAEPLIPLLPVQPPDAVQLLAFVELHVKVDVPPLATDVGLALNETVGAGGGGVPAVTVTDALREPPVPLQVSVNVVVACSAAVVALPLVALLPVQPPEAVQLVALVLLHVRCVVLPTTTDVGLALKVTTGAGVVAVTVTVAVLLTEPPAPEQARVYDVVLVSPETLWLPLAPLVPDQPPEAVQLLASALDHVSVELPPLATVAGLAVNVSVGAAAEIEMLTDCMAVPPEPPQVRV